MTVAPSMPLKEVITALRGTNPDAKPIASVAQLRIIMDALRLGESLADTLANPELAAFTSADLLYFVEEFGKHRARVRKQQAVKASPVPFSLSAGHLFGYSREMLDSLGMFLADGGAFLARKEFPGYAKADRRVYRQLASLLVQQHVLLATSGDQLVAVYGADDVSGQDVYLDVTALARSGALDATTRAGLPVRMVQLWAASDAVDGELSYTRFDVAELVRDGKSIPDVLRTEPVPSGTCVKRSVIVPPGYEKSDTQPRDIGKSLAAAAVDPVTEAELIRFEVIQHPPTAVLNARHLGNFCWVARNGLGHLLLDFAGLTRAVGPVTASGAWPLTYVGGANTGVAKLMVEAYDLLEVVRADAMSALAVLTADSGTDPSELLSATRKCRWVAPADIDRLERTLREVERTPGNDRLQAVLRTQLVNFARWVKQNPSTFNLTDVGQLNEAHRKQILVLTGLVTNGTEEKAVRAELRTRLTEMGLAADLDREIDKGVAAFNAGMLEEFYASRQARLDGDPDWRLRLELDQIGQSIEEQAPAMSTTAA